MGLMDRDYMHERRPERAFTPAPEKSAVNTLFMVLVFVAALFLLYKLADWQLGKRPTGSADQSVRAVQAVQPTPRQTSPRADTSPLALAAQREPNPYPEASEPTAGNRMITKCLVNGKTSYGDDPCAGGAVTTQVSTRADHNIMKPVHVSRTTQTTQTETTFSPAPVVIAQNTAASDYAAKKFECQSLDAHIRYLDSMSRQPQGAQMMDWIRDERKKTRDRQFRIPCQ